MKTAFLAFLSMLALVPSLALAKADFDESDFYAPNEPSAGASTPRSADEVFARFDERMRRVQAMRAGESKDANIYAAITEVFYHLTAITETSFEKAAELSMKAVDETRRYQNLPAKRRNSAEGVNLKAQIEDTFDKHRTVNQAVQNLKGGLSRVVEVMQSYYYSNVLKRPRSVLAQMVPGILRDAEIFQRDYEAPAQLLSSVEGSLMTWRILAPTGQSTLDIFLEQAGEEAASLSALAQRADYSPLQARFGSTLTVLKQNYRIIE